MQKFENFNLTATNAVLMKLTIMYLHNNFNLAKRGVVLWITGKSFVQIGSHLGELSMKNHTKKIQNDCFWYYTSFWRTLKWELQTLTAGNLLWLCNLMFSETFLGTTSHKSHFLRIRQTTIDGCSIVYVRLWFWPSNLWPNSDFCPKMLKKFRVIVFSI